MILLQADPTAAATEAVKALEKGEFSQVLQQLISLGVEAGKSILLALLIFVVGRYAIKLINRVVGGMMERRQVEPTIQSFLKSFINVLLTILLIISTVSALGVNTTSFAALLASAGVAVGMALSGNLQNLAGGIILLLFKPYKVGDFIEAQGWQAIQMSEGLTWADMTGTGTGSRTPGTAYGTGIKPPKRPSSTRRWVCPDCGTIIRSTKEVNVICGDCGKQFIRAD